TQACRRALAVVGLRAVSGCRRPLIHFCRQRDKAGVFQAARTTAQVTLARGLEDLSSLARCAHTGAISFDAIRAGQLRVLQQILARGNRAAAALEAVRAVCRSRPGRSPGKSFRGENFWAGGEAANAGDDE